MLSVGFHDKLRDLFGLQPAYVKLVGNTSQLAFMQVDAHEYTSYFSKHPKLLQVCTWLLKDSVCCSLGTILYNS